MKHLLLMVGACLVPYFATSQLQTCDLELLDINWDQQEITLTLNNDLCSNSSTPNWVPAEDSVYVMQLGFSFGGTNCLIPANSTAFQPPLGLNDTITYSFAEWNDTFNCFDAAFLYYQENCSATVSAVGPNNSINLDLISGNNWIGFSPTWDNCYDSDPDDPTETLSITEIPEGMVYTVYDSRGQFLYMTRNLNWLEMRGLYFIKYGDQIKKIFVERE